MPGQSAVERGIGHRLERGLEPELGALSDLAADPGLAASGLDRDFTDAATQQPNFRIPADNPHVVPAKGGTWDGFYNGTDHSAVLATVRDEIWATGFRNP